jgi:hypothetical protein
MSASLVHAAPIRFVIGTLLVWTIGRGLALADWSRDAPVLHDAAPPRQMATPVRSEPFAGAAFVRQSTPPPGVRTSASPVPSPILIAAALPAALPAPPPVYRRSDGMTEMRAITAEARHRPRLSGSAWAFVRGGRGSALAPGGQIGGGQAGMRLLYRLDANGALSASARLSGTLGGPAQTEAAVGLDWQPFRKLPVHLMVERRMAIDHGGRNAWTAGAAGGVYAVPLAQGWRLDGYGEAGVVGTRRRDLYVDGAMRAGREIGLGHRRSLTLGPGLWGAAQPGAARLDVGPSAVLRLPVRERSLAVALDWRQRVAGGARPGSGMAFTVASDF